MILMLSVRLAGTIHSYVSAYAPTNILVRWLRIPGTGQRLALPVAAVLAVTYGLLGSWLNTIIDSGGPGWLNLLVLMCAWNTIKLGVTCVALVTSALGRTFGAFAWAGRRKGPKLGQACCSGHSQTGVR